MKTQLLQNQGNSLPLQPHGFTTRVSSHRGLILSFSLLILSMFWVQKVFGQYTYSIPGTYYIDATGIIGHNTPPGYEDGIEIRSGVTLIIEDRVGGRANASKLMHMVV